ASSPIDWEDDRKPRRALRDTVIYECHLKGFTAHPSSAVSSPGTYLGIIDKIPHLQRLGITAVELLPLQEFNEREPIGTDPVSGKTLHNFWGYNTLGFFCPEMTYSHRGEPDSAVHEFQEMVKQFHRAGIEVLLDVVFNHTGEGHQLGPTLGFRGFDNSIYYLLDNGRYYANYSGCGNTVNCNHPVVKQFILDCLRFWVVEMHVDGFRFDLATILGRSDSGDWIGDLSLLNDIVGDPILRGGKLIAESWDAAGMYKVGGFPTGWAEWNGRFRDDIRRFSRGDAGLAVDFARRLGGSFDLFSSKADPAPSINFVTCHDGFTLRDLVSYRQKHNMRNGENNRDGADENFSSNLGVVGDASDPTVLRDRIRRAKNMMTALMLARGTPMLLAGDELWRSQGGNNNTYCQDNDTGWLDWTPTPEGEEMERFLRMLVWLRRRHPALRRSSFVDPIGKQSSTRRDITWHGVKLYQPDWAHSSHSLALQIHGEPLNGDLPDDDFYLAFNNWSEALLFELPRAPWRRLVDTHADSPADIFEEGEAPLVGKRSYLVHAFSALVLHSPSAARVRPTPRR
ncbi:MAG: alpha-amylase family glycosyl hydrolase, partial [Myxococcota bacterium]|nr:alpha-amylase family glycosyl hydrolase [Myxococcota bacterium]